jgi:RimJ/RimL family protein N-acetyltransferase
MILRHGHIELRLIDESTIELLRKWRNSSEINEFMEYQAKISQEQQLKWFQNLSKENNFYFIIYVDNKPLGMIHLSDIIEKDAQSGIFIAEHQFQGTGVAFTASILLLDFAFETLKLRSVFAKVKDDNFVAQDYNKLLGFERIKVLNESFSNWQLKKENYTIQRKVLKKLLD